MIISSGLVILKQKKILLIKPKGVPEKGHFSIPKGMVEEGESLIEAAIRETYEETGLLIAESMINDINYTSVPYINKNVMTKIVHFFIVRVSEDFCADVLPSSFLQKSEVDHAEFYTKQQAMELVFWRFHKYLNNIEF